MAEKIVMPKAGMAMETGVIVSWLKEIGDQVAYGEPLLEIETDKTTMQVESMSEGHLLSKLYEAGAQVPVVTTIGYIGRKGEQPPAAETQPDKPGEQVQASPVQKEQKQGGAAPAPTGGKPMATPAARRLARERGVSLEALSVAGIIRARDIPAPSAVKATPLAQRIARQKGIALEDVQGSGHGGKIFSGDLPAERQAEGQASAELEAGDRLVPLNGMRKTIARRMLQSHTEIPPVTLNSEADVTALAELRGAMNKCEGVKISFNDLIIKACAVALGEFPGINASYTPEGILQKTHINIGMAVALEEGLIVPVLQNADRLTLKAISSTAKELAAKARENRLSPDEYTGGTFTISNLGMFGITSFTPIINLPESCILGVCAITERAANVEGQVAFRKYMGLSLTFDHRCVDGAGGAKFLQRVVALLENPVEILL